MIRPADGRGGFPNTRPFGLRLPGLRIQQKQPRPTSGLFQQHLVVVVGASAGGVKELLTLISTVGNEFSGTLVVVLHRLPEMEMCPFCDLVTSVTSLSACRISDGDHLKPATIHINNPVETIRIRGNRFRAERDQSCEARMSRIDQLMISCADEFLSNAVGVILSGTLDDGVAGLQAIQQRGGRCLVQQPTEAGFADLPENALAAIEPDFVGTTRQIGERLKIMAACHPC